MLKTDRKSVLMKKRLLVGKVKNSLFLMMDSRRRSSSEKAGIFGLLTSAVVLAACGGGNTIQVGVANEEPYGYIDTDAGEVTGPAQKLPGLCCKKWAMRILKGLLLILEH